MKRATKNWLMGALLVITIVLTGFTIYFAGASLSTVQPTNSPNIQPVGGMMGNGDTPPEIPNKATGSQEEPPAKPDGESTPPEMPEDGQMMPGGQMPSDSAKKATLNAGFYILFVIESLVISVLALYLILSKGNQIALKETFHASDKIIIMILATIILTTGITFGAKCLAENVIASSTTQDQNLQGPDGMNAGDMNTNISYNATTEFTTNTTITNGTYTSSNADENAISASGKIEATLSNITVTKTGDSTGGDNTSFYGINSAIIAKDGATLTLKNITVETAATGANGVFSYGGSATTNNTTGDGTTITISDSKITTTKDASGGIMATGGGIINAQNLTIETSGVSSAAIRTDRGGGTVTVDGGTYTTNGAGSPSIYSTADVTVKNATLIANASEGIVIEGKNNVTLDNVTLTDNNSKLNGLSTTYKNIFLYQSVSGDAAEGTSTFTAKNITLTTKQGDTFYITNTSAIISLTGNTIKNIDTTGNFLRAQQDSWGKSGSNGGEVILNLTQQDAIGNIVIDEISTLEMTMQSSYFEGTLNGDNTAKTITLTLDTSSTIKLTGDSYVTKLEDADTNYSNIDFNGYKLYVNGKSIN